MRGRVRTNRARREQAPPFARKPAVAYEPGVRALRLSALTLFLCASTGCTTTAIVVVLDPAIDVDAVRLTATHADRTEVRESAVPVGEWPATWTVRSGRGSGDLSLDVIASAGGREVAHERVRVSFVPGRVMQLYLRVGGGCECVPACTELEVCADGTCTAEEVLSASALTVWTGEPSPGDAGACDDMTDAGAPDGGSDAGGDGGLGDAGSDAGSDGGLGDAGSDAGSDAGLVPDLDHGRRCAPGCPDTYQCGDQYGYADRCRAGEDCYARPVEDQLAFCRMRTGTAGSVCLGTACTIACDPMDLESCPDGACAVYEYPLTAAGTQSFAICEGLRTPPASCTLFPEYPDYAPVGCGPGFICDAMSHECRPVCRVGTRDCGSELCCRPRARSFSPEVPTYGTCGSCTGI